MERGYYVFACPVGYRYQKCGSHGRMLVRKQGAVAVLEGRGEEIQSLLASLGE